MRYDTVQREFTIISMRLLKLSNDFKHLARELARERESDNVSGMHGDDTSKKDDSQNLGGVPKALLSDLF